jgi:glutamate 5-kinase
MGHRVVLVTSAAVGTGLRRLNMTEKPKKFASIQVKHVSINLSLIYFESLS